MNAAPFHRLRRLALLVASVLAVATAPARAELRIDITRGITEPTPIAVQTFGGGGGGPEAQMGRDMANVVAADLDRSGVFRTVDPRGFLQDAASSHQAPRFPDWKVTGAQGLVTGAVSRQGDGQLRVEFRLWDVVIEQQLAGLTLSTSASGWRRVAHIIADTIYKRITGEDGYFDTRIVYIAESGPATNRTKRLAIMDQDGENHRFLTDGKTLVLTPRFSPTMQEITYLSYFNKKPRVYLFNLETGRQEVLGDFPGMTFAPRYSPDGGQVIMSLADGTGTNLYALDLRSRRQHQITDGAALDTSPSYSPDGSQIAFESDRGGTQQIYTMSAGGGGVKRLTFGEGQHGAPVWSPRGDYIAFTRISGSQFAIGIIRPDGTGERILSQAYHVEGPTWAPNGRVLMYFKETASGDGRGRHSRLYTITIGGGTERALTTPVDASDPAWSPLSRP